MEKVCFPLTYLYPDIHVYILFYYNVSLCVGLYAFLNVRLCIPYREGQLDAQEVEVEVPRPSSDFDSFGNNPTAVDAMKKFVSMSKQSTEKRRMTVAEAKVALEEAEVERLVEQHDVVRDAIHAVEQSGVVVIDEIDKIVSSSDHSRGSDASAEGVQRDLLPIVEGTTVTTKKGNVNTEYILFIAAGSFHSVKPSDLLPELQGRLPIRVQLNALTEMDLYRILTEPVNNLLKQQVSHGCVST